MSSAGGLPRYRSSAPIFVSRKYSSSNRRCSSGNPRSASSLLVDPHCTPTTKDRPAGSCAALANILACKRLGPESHRLPSEPWRRENVWDSGVRQGWLCPRCCRKLPLDRLGRCAAECMVPLLLRHRQRILRLCARPNSARANAAGHQFKPESGAGGWEDRHFNRSHHGHH